MDATRLLEEQHDEVMDLFEKYESAEDPKVKERLFAEIADNLAAHATIEEKLFYPAVYVGELEEMLEEAVEEHLAAKRLMADLLGLSATDGQYDAKMKVLKEQIEHHVDEEEEELFAKVRKSFTKQELESLGEEMEAMFEDLLQTHPRRELPAQVDEAAPLP